MSTTDYIDPDLDELYALADQLLGNMEAAGELILRTEPTLYAECGRKPQFPFWLNWRCNNFGDYWASL